LYLLPEHLRQTFAEPFGAVYTTPQLLQELHRRDRIIAVGDIVAKTLIENGQKPRVIVVDYKTKRGAIDPELKRVLGGYGQKVFRVANPAATISDELFHAIQQALKSKQIVRIEVDGEEDLAGLPFMAIAKDKTVVLYGVPDKGVCLVEVNRGVRQTALDLLQQMRVPGADEKGAPRRIRASEVVEDD
jgi:GTP-dependent dephospho-CoA kinase